MTMCGVPCHAKSRGSQKATFNTYCVCVLQEAWQTTSLDQFLLSESYHPGNNSKSSKTQTAQTGIGLSHLLDAYTVKVEKTIKDWIKNIVEVMEALCLTLLHPKCPDKGGLLMVVLFRAE